MLHRYTTKKTPLLQSVVIISLATLMCVLFTTLNPPYFHIERIDSLSARVAISPQRLSYWWRFSLSTILLGFIPLVTSRFLGLSPRQLGLTLGGSYMRRPQFLIALPIALAIGVYGGSTPELRAYYPYARDLIAIVKQDGLIHLWGHLSAYLIFYYVPWEFFFRGFMLMPFVYAVKELEAGCLGREGNSMRELKFLLAAGILFQTLPSTMLHFGHPASEILSAIPAGLLFGYVAYSSRSILPALILHALVGFGTDGYIVLSSVGVFG